MQLSSHLGFNGNCEEGMKFYAETFGGTVVFKMTWKESPMCGQVEADFQDKVLSALRFQFGGHVEEAMPFPILVPTHP